MPGWGSGGEQREDGKDGRGLSRQCNELTRSNVMTEEPLLGVQCLHSELGFSWGRLEEVQGLAAHGRRFWIFIFRFIENPQTILSQEMTVRMRVKEDF